MKHSDLSLAKVLNVDRDAVAERIVIPAKAGIQFEYVVRSTLNLFMLSAPHIMFELDSSLLKAEHIHMLSPRAGFRRNDVRRGNALRQAPCSAVRPRGNR